MCTRVKTVMCGCVGIAGGPRLRSSKSVLCFDGSRGVRRKQARYRKAFGDSGVTGRKSRPIHVSRLWCFAATFETAVQRFA